MHNLDLDCVSLMADFYQVDVEEMTQKINEVRDIVTYVYMYVTLANL